MQQNLMVAELKAQLKQTCTIISNFVFKNVNQIKTLQFNFLFSFSTFFMYENNLEGVKETGKKTINQRLILSLKKKQSLVSSVTIKSISYKAQQSEILVEIIRSQISLFSSLKSRNSTKTHGSRA